MKQRPLIYRRKEVDPTTVASTPKRTINRAKPKVRLDGTPDPTCIPCQKKKR